MKGLQPVERDASGFSLRCVDATRLEIPGDAGAALSPALLARAAGDLRAAAPSRDAA